MADYRRLFISGIPVGATEDEIRKRFQVFGEISSIEKVVRSQEGFPTRCFAYLDTKECFYSSNSLKDVLKTAEGGHTFNFTTSTPKDKNSSTTMVTGSKNTPNWLLTLQDDDSESSGTDKTVSTIGPHNDGQKRTLFFFHANSSELRNRLHCPDTKFVRTCSLEELEAKWPQTRARLKEQYKRRHRDALRWLRQRKQIK